MSATHSIPKETQSEAHESTQIPAWFNAECRAPNRSSSHQPKWTDHAPGLCACATALQENRAQTITIAGLVASIGHLSQLLEEQHALLVDVEEICGRDGHGGQLEDGESEIIDRVRAHLQIVNGTSTLPQPMATSSNPHQSARHHHDDKAVDLFATAMKTKLAKQRAKGHGGWDDKEKCPDGRLQKMLADHLPKGDPVDVANFAMFLWHRGESTAMPTTTGTGRDDPKYETAVQIVLSHGNASISLLQFLLHIGYLRATALIEAMQGTIVSHPDADGNRHVLVPHP